MIDYDKIDSIDKQIDELLEQKRVLSIDTRQSQKTLVYNCISMLCNTMGIEVGTVYAHRLDKAFKRRIHKLVMEGFNPTDTSISRHLLDKFNRGDDYKESYVSGLINNWLRKDPRYGYDSKKNRPRRDSSIQPKSIEIDVSALPEPLRYLVTESDSDPRPNPIPTSTLNTDGKSRACSCGARHTSNPNYHMSYCDMREWK